MHFAFLIYRAQAFFFFFKKSEVSTKRTTLFTILAEWFHLRKVTLAWKNLKFRAKECDWFIRHHHEVTLHSWQEKRLERKVLREGEKVPEWSYD